MCLCDNILKTKRKRVKNIQKKQIHFIFFLVFLKKKRCGCSFFEASRYEEGLDKFRIYHLYLGFTHARIHTHTYT
jgi:hypothetical protein